MFKSVKDYVGDLISLTYLFCKSKSIRRIPTINNTKIKYISVADKIYEVTTIQWLHSYLEAKETDLSNGDVEESELCDIFYFKDFYIRLVNRKNEIKIIDIKEWVKNHKSRL